MTEALWIALAGIVLLLFLVFCRVWVGFAMMIVGFLGLIVLKSQGYALEVLGMEPFSQTAAYTFTCMPLFCLMGALISDTGIGEKLFNFASKMIGHIKGGLGMASIVACAIFAAICGSSQATAITMAKVAYPEMRRHGYKDAIAAGCLSAGGTIGIMIPPSVGFILYGLLTQESIGKLFMAGLIPGILQAVLYCGVFFILGKLFPAWVPASPKATWGERAKSVGGVWPTLALLILVLGGIYGGFFTATEAGAVGAAGAIIIAMMTRTLTKKNLHNSFVEGARTTGMIMVMIIGAQVFLRFMTAANLPNFLTSALTGLNVNRYVILIGIVLMYMVLGCVFDIMSGLLLTVPILYPVMTSLGFNGLWFGVLVVRMMELGEITPPIGLNAFVMSNAADVPVFTVFKGIVPFMLADFVHIILICAVPGLCLLLV